MQYGETREIKRVLTIITYLAHHENLIRLGKVGKLFERAHEALVVVAATGGINQDNVEALGGGVSDGVTGDLGGVLAVSLLVELDLAALADGQLLEVADVDSELFDGAGAEGVAGSDENAVFILKEEEAHFGKVG